jgi:hypothetical protein
MEYLCFFRRVIIYISFLGGVQPKSIDALNGEVTVRSIFQHVSVIRWARIEKRRLISSAKGFSV